MLGALPWLPFADPADRWLLAADALACVRMSVTGGAEGSRWTAGPKGLGPPSGILVTVLAARVVHHLATAGACVGNVCTAVCAGLFFLRRHGRLDAEWGRTRGNVLRPCVHEAAVYDVTAPLQADCTTLTLITRSSLTLC